MFGPREFRRVVLTATILGVFLTTTSVYAAARRRAVEPTFPGFKYLEWSCFIATDHAKDIEAVRAYDAAHAPVPAALVRAFEWWDTNERLIRVIHDEDFCGPDDRFQVVPEEQARDIFEALQLIVTAAEILRGAGAIP